MLKLIKRGRHYYLRGTVRGVQVYETTKTESQELADAIRIGREKEILERSIYGPTATVTFEEAAITYCETATPSGTQRAMIIGRRLADGSLSWNLVDAIGKKKLSAVNQELMDRLARERFPDAAPATIQRQLITPVTSVLKTAAKRGWCLDPHFERPKSSETRVRWLTPDEAHALLSASADHLKPLILFLLGTGARLSEALELKWQDVDLQDVQCHFWNTKNGTTRRALIPPSAVAGLANLGHRAGRVFLTQGGNPYADLNRESGGQIKTAFKGAVKRSGIDPVTPHGLRHAWASWFYASSKDALLLKSEGGWKSISQVDRYAHLVPSHHLAGVNEFWGGEHPAIRAESVQPAQVTRKA